ncbi:hypothetical protein Droror1_Dr00028032 [Drosera rotundifolia]
MLSQKLKLQHWRSTAKNVADRALIVAKFLCFLHVADNYLCAPTLVHGPSMLPTLNMRGDVVLTERVLHRIGNVGVGDVVLVVSPENPRKMITKRVVAREGDRVSVVGDGIWGDVLRSFVVPKGHVWVQGDNLYQSRDSRIFGPVPYGLIKGRVFLRVWPLDEFGSL